ncbi:MAG: hypothetical protein JXR85_07410 [Deltaproteobacteria bacterium]|nr:hypothetical protein [Deltaproteobacteria bacterium]
MAEIKSTLDLMLEKTRHMTLSDEEKKELLLKEINGKIKGWIQKFRDRRLTAEEIRTELNRARQDYASAEVIKLFKKSLIRSIEPDGDNAPAFDLLERVLGEDTSRMSLLLDTFNREMEQEKKRIADQRGRQLSEQGISGSAVVPNHVKDGEWTTAFAGRLAVFTEKRTLIADS